MRNAILAAVSIAALLSAPAMADDGSQIRVVGYSATRRTEIVGIVGQPTTFTFPVGEQVYRIVQTGNVGKDGAVSDAGWQGPTAEDLKTTPLGNNLTLWPVRAGTSTMSVITTAPDGNQKVYPFKLIARPTDADSEPDVVLNLIFRGSASATSGVTPAATPVAASGTPVAKPTQTAIASWRAAQKEKAEAKLRQDRVEAFAPVDGTCHYTAKGKRPNSITPLCPLTDHQWVMMRFPGLSKKPAVYIGSCVDGTNEERLARQHSDRDFIVVEEIAPNFCLRLGSEVLDIRDDAFDPVGKPSGSGTIYPTIQRDLIQAKAVK